MFLGLSRTQNNKRDSLNKYGGKLMKELLYGTCFSYQKENTDWLILNLLHELRIMTVKQICKLINQEIFFDESSVYRRLTSLLKLELVDYIQMKKDSNIRYFFLTKKGHNSIGGLYSFPKVPEYNLKHHIEVTNYLIESLAFAKQKPTFYLAQSERRQMYEKKDFSKLKKGTIFHVSDYMLRFENQYGERSDWYFEIELTLKSQNRYIRSIFPKYITLLQNKLDYHVVYVTPSRIIYDSLDTFKDYFEVQSLEKEVFERLHILSSQNFEKELNLLFTENEFINSK